METINEFYAVTRSASVYRVEYLATEKKCKLTKIALAGKSGVPVGASKTGDFVCLEPTFMLMLCNEPNDAKSTNITRAIADSIIAAQIITWTSPVVAICKTEATALRIMKEEKLQVCDPRWFTETREIVWSIGHEHPVFILSSQLDFTNIRS